MGRDKEKRIGAPLGKAQELIAQIPSPMERGSAVVEVP